MVHHSLLFFSTLVKILILRKILHPDNKIEIFSFPFVTVILPARIEELNIRRCIESLLNQSYDKNYYKIIVVNDNSTDSTELIVKNYENKNSHVKCVRAGVLPEGWTIKNHACWTRDKYAEGDFICFIDADTKAESDLLKLSISYAIQNNIDLLSVSPFQEVVSTTEQIFLPAIFLSIASTMNFQNINNPNRNEAIANGQFLLFRKNVYDSVNGHKGIRNNIMDDIAFAEIIKNSRYRLFFIFGDKLITTRMYKENLGRVFKKYFLYHAKTEQCLFIFISFEIFYNWLGSGIVTFFSFSFFF